MTLSNMDGWFHFSIYFYSTMEVYSSNFKSLTHWLVDIITWSHLLSVVEVSSVVQCWEQQKQQHFPSIPQDSRALAGGCHMRNSCHNHWSHHYLLLPSAVERQQHFPSIVPQVSRASAFGCHGCHYLFGWGTLAVGRRSLFSCAVLGPAAQVSHASACGCYITCSVEELLPLVVEVSWLVDVITCQHEELLLSVIEVSSVVQCWDQQRQHFPSIPQVSRASACGYHYLFGWGTLAINHRSHHYVLALALGRRSLFSCAVLGPPAAEAAAFPFNGTSSLSWPVDVITCSHEELLPSVVEVSSVSQCWEQQQQQHFPSIVPQVSHALALVHEQRGNFAVSHWRYSCCQSLSSCALWSCLERAFAGIKRWVCCMYYLLSQQHHSPNLSM